MSIELRPMVCNSTTLHGCMESIYESGLVLGSSREGLPEDASADLRVCKNRCNLFGRPSSSQQFQRQFFNGPACYNLYGPMRATDVCIIFSFAIATQGCPYPFSGNTKGLRDYCDLNTDSSDIFALVIEFVWI